MTTATATPVGVEWGMAMARTARLFFVLLALLMAAGAGFAAPLGQQIGYSGYTRYLGTAYTGALDVIFKVYDVATGGIALWEEDWTLAAAHPQVNFVDGEFSVNLGTYTPFAGSLDFHSNTQYYLEITLASTVLSPRKPLLFVPYSFSTQIDTRTSDPSSPVAGQMWLIVP
jgi:hypothetical protein